MAISSSLLTEGFALVRCLSLDLDLRDAMMQCLYHAQTLWIGQLASMRRLCNRCLISSVWALVLWLIVRERRTASKSVDSTELSSIICNGLVALFGGQAALNAGKNCARWIFNRNMARIGRNDKTELPSGERSRLERADSNGVRGFAARTASDNRRSRGRLLFDGIDGRL